LVVPKALRDALGLSAGTVVDCEARDGEIRISVPSRVRRKDGPAGPRFLAPDAPALPPAHVRDLVERDRR